MTDVSTAVDDDDGASLPAWDRRRWIVWSASLFGVLAIPVCWALLFVHRDGACRNLTLVANFAGSVGAFNRLATNGRGGDCGLADLTAFHAHLGLCVAFALVYSAVLFVVCRYWWRWAWLTHRFTSAAPICWLAILAGGCDIAASSIEFFEVHRGVSDGQSVVRLSGGFALLLPVLSWVKVFSFTAVWLAAVFTLVGAMSRRRLTSPARPGLTPYERIPVEGLGVACSGGGIRAASLSLGVLGVLERFSVAPAAEKDDTPALVAAAGTRGLLYQAKFIASVSGGGYTAGGWRTASASSEQGAVREPIKEEDWVSRWPGGVIGDPHCYPELPPLSADSHVGEGHPSLYRHVQQRREFLRSSRGGLPASLIIVLLFLIFHLLLIATLLVVVAWPIGRLAPTWFVLGDVDSSAATIFGQVGQQLTIEPRLYGPALFFGVTAGVVLGLCLFQWNTDLRRRMMTIGWGVAGASAITGFVLIVVPWMLDVAYPFLNEHFNVQAITAISSVGGVLGVVIGLVRRVVLPRLVFLGGVLLAVAAAFFALEVAGQAAVGRGVFSLSWWRPLRGAPLWAGLCLVLLLGYFGLCPRWWSLHTLYRNRLRTAFVTTRQRTLAPWGIRKLDRTSDTGVAENPQQRMWPVRKYKEPLLSEYANAPGPQHLVCCAAARSDKRATGVKALSFVIDPHHVEFHDIGYSNDGLITTTHRANTDQWVQALGSRWARRAEGSVSAAVSVSAAAVAPSMGRQNIGSTNALIAALNLRLGTWYPNPRYVPTTGDHVRFPWVRLSYLLKEILGYFDLADHHLYVTDGGHRENLGLVELLRRRCKTMICIDSSGDTPGSYTTLRQAAELARLEVGATINLTALPAPGSPPPQWAHTILPVTYNAADGSKIGTGTIIHIAALMYEEAPNDLTAYGLEDVRFPHYSTGDQFLTEEQYRRLVLFGEAAATKAFAQGDVRTALGDAIGLIPAPGQCGT
jgi:hypothetical protein